MPLTYNAAQAHRSSHLHWTESNPLSQTNAWKRALDLHVGMNVIDISTMKSSPYGGFLSLVGCHEVDIIFRRPQYTGKMNRTQWTWWTISRYSLTSYPVSFLFSSENRVGRYVQWLPLVMLAFIRGFRSWRIVAGWYQIWRFKHSRTTSLSVQLRSNDLWSFVCVLFDSDIDIGESEKKITEVETDPLEHAP